MWMKYFLETIFLATILTFSAPVIAPEIAWDGTLIEREIVLPDPIPDYTPEDILCLQKNIYFEARGEGLDGMKAVAAVTMNRTEDSRFPSTVCGVVYQRSQFSWTHQLGNQNFRKNEKLVWDQAGLIAEQALQNKLEHKAGGSLFFHAKHVKPGWSHKKAYVTTIGGHLFYK